VAWQAPDVTDAASFAFADAAQARFVRVNVLINDAGAMLLSPLAALKPDEWTRMIEVNIYGVLNGFAAVLPALRRARRRPLNIALIAAHFVMPRLTSPTLRSPRRRRRDRSGDPLRTGAARGCGH
jgi:NADP-dependent 3-hydroxy acid dehydrogenase YdfG